MRNLFREGLDYLGDSLTLKKMIIITLLSFFIVTIIIFVLFDHALAAEQTDVFISQMNIVSQLNWDCERLLSPIGQGFVKLFSFWSTIFLATFTIASIICSFQLGRTEKDEEYDGPELQDDKDFGRTMERQGITVDNIITPEGRMKILIFKAIIFSFLLVPSLGLAADACKCCPPVGLDDVYEECFLQYNGITDSVHLVRLDGTVAATLRNPSKEVESLVKKMRLFYWYALMGEDGKYCYCMFPK